MGLELRVERTIKAAPAEVFALTLDSARFPPTFRGCGPIPGLRRIVAQAPSAVGSTRTVESSDGSLLTERIIALDPPHHHAYTLSGLRPPLAWLARAGEADWTFAALGNSTHVSWKYVFTLTSAFAWPLAAPLLHLFMRGAMRRCLTAMARELEKAN